MPASGDAHAFMCSTFYQKANLFANILKNNSSRLSTQKVQEGGGGRQKQGVIKISWKSFESFIALLTHLAQFPTHRVVLYILQPFSFFSLFSCLVRWLVTNCLCVGRCDACAEWRLGVGQDHCGGDPQETIGTDGSISTP